ncbi:septum formation initiator family protein [Pilibacter termitis]|nr:septum formation initiator family protein [Pilibacter termitis]
MRDNVIPLNNEHTIQKNKENMKQRKKEVFKRRRIAVIFVLAMVLFTIPSIRLFEAYNELVSNQSEFAKAISEQKELKKEKAKAEKQVKLLQDDEYVAKVARSKYLYSKKGEAIYPDLAPFLTENRSNEGK